jgi:hypothetical protein
MTTNVTFAQTKLSEVQSATDELKTKTDALKTKIDMLKPQCPSEAPITVTSTESMPVPVTANGGSEWADFPGLQSTLKLTETRTVAIFFQISDAVLDVPPPNNVGSLGGRLEIGGVTTNPVISPDNVRARTVESLWIGTLDAGDHLVKVQYRSTAEAVNAPLDKNYVGRVLYIVELGCP